MKFHYPFIMLGILALSCENTGINKNQEITRNDKVMDLLNSGDTTRVQHELSGTKVDKERMILASSLAMDAGIDIYQLLPLLKVKLFDKPISEGLHRDSLGKLAKKLTKNTELKVRIAVSQKNIDSLQSLLGEAIIEIEKSDDALTSVPVILIKEKLSLLAPDLPVLFEQNKKVLLEKLLEIKEKLHSSSGQSVDGESSFVEVNLGTLKSDAVRLMVGIIEIIPIIELAPVLEVDDYAKLNQALIILKDIDSSNRSLFIRANKHIALLSSVAIVNKARDVFKLQGDYTDLICKQNAQSLGLFVDSTEHYFAAIHLASQKIADISKESTFVKMSFELQSLLLKTKDEKDGVFASVKVFLDKEKAKYCE